jgi:ketosteroid isomerase-like protein
MSTETDALEQFYAAINRNEMAAIVKDFDPEIVRIEPDGFPSAGTYRGIAAVQEHVARGRGTWAEGSCDPEGFFENGDIERRVLRARVVRRFGQGCGTPPAFPRRLGCGNSHPPSLPLYASEQSSGSAKRIIGA